VSIPKIEGPISNSSESWAKLREDFGMAVRPRRTPNRPSDWKYVESSADIRACETEFLRRAGKSQDVLVCRFLNRPISRAVTQRLLQRDMDPNTWTMAILILPAVAFFVMLKGD